MTKELAFIGIAVIAALCVICEHEKFKDLINYTTLLGVPALLLYIILA